MATVAPKEFKNTEIFAEAYSEKYEEYESLYKSVNSFKILNFMQYFSLEKSK